MPWKKLLAWATGQVDEALRQKLEFVWEENRVYRALLDRHSPRWRLQDAERKVLAEKGERLCVGLSFPAVPLVVRLHVRGAQRRQRIDPILGSSYRETGRFHAI